MIFTLSGGMVMVLLLACTSFVSITGTQGPYAPEAIQTPSTQEPAGIPVQTAEVGDLSAWNR